MSLDLYPVCYPFCYCPSGGELGEGGTGEELGRTVQGRSRGRTGEELGGGRYRGGAGEDGTGEELKSGAILCRNILLPVL